MNATYLERRKPRIIEVIKINDKQIEVYILKVVDWSSATITDEILEYIPHEKALDFKVARNVVKIEPGDDPSDVADGFKDDEGFSECDYYRFTQVQTFYVESPENLN